MIYLNSGGEMSRIARVVVPNYFYHITQRGNNRQEIFIKDDDRRKYLLWMNEYKRKSNVEIFSYCLMNNHVHFIGRPLMKDSLAKLFHIVQVRYAQYFNKSHGNNGHLWQSRYYSCILDEKHFAAAVRYVERNPVRAGIVDQPWRWPWSSAAHHIGAGKSILELENIRNFIPEDRWQDFLSEPDRSGDLQSIRKLTQSGRVWGSEEYIEKLERIIGMKLTEPSMGRPKK